MAVQDNPVMALRAPLHQLPCPICGSHELIPMLQCDYYPDGCLWLVCCEHCETQYHINHRSVPTWAEEQKVATEAAQTRATARLTEEKRISHANP